MLKIQELSFWERHHYFEGIDFLITGGGIVGCSTAYHLRQQFPDAKILVVERGYLPSGASTKNAGFACFGSPTELLDDLKNMHAETVWSTVAERYEGLRYLQEILGSSNIDYQQHGSWDLITYKDDKIAREVRDQLTYLNAQLQLITGESSVFSEDQHAPGRFGFQHLTTTFYNRLEGQVNTALLMQRYQELLSSSGILTLSGMEVQQLHPDESLVETNIGPISARHLLLTVNGFAGQWLKEDVHPARAQVLVTSPIPHLALKGTYHYQSGYYYFRNIGDRILLGGGRNLDKAGETTTDMHTTDLIQESLHTLLREVIIPGISYTTDYQWAGIMGVGAAKEPIVKQVHPNLSVGVRLGGMGVAIGSLVGKRLAQLCK